MNYIYNSLLVSIPAATKWVNLNMVEHNQHQCKVAAGPKEQ